jgi:hypothetical protein
MSQENVEPIALGGASGSRFAPSHAQATPSPARVGRMYTAVSEASGCQTGTERRLASSGGQARGHDTKEARNEGSRKARTT